MKNSLSNEVSKLEYKCESQEYEIKNLKFLLYRLYLKNGPYLYKETFSEEEVEKIQALTFTFEQIGEDIKLKFWNRDKLLGK